MKLKKVIKLLDTQIFDQYLHHNDNDFYHIPNNPLATMDYVTLCGCDMDYEELEITANTMPNCPQCLEILKYCKNLKIPK